MRNVADEKNNVHDCVFRYLVIRFNLGFISFKKLAPKQKLEKGGNHMTCDFCGTTKGDGSYCPYCETHWRDDLRNNQNIPHTVSEKISRLSMKQKEKIYPLEVWQCVLWQEREYGFKLQIAGGDEGNKKVVKQRKSLEKLMKNIVAEAIERYEELIEGKPKTKTPVQEMDYVHIRYGKDF